jgi:hypothetical protein
MTTPTNFRSHPLKRQKGRREEGRPYVPNLGQEREEFGPDYQGHGVLFCCENGTPPHPDTITRRFQAAVRGGRAP